MPLAEVAGVLRVFSGGAAGRAKLGSFCAASLEIMRAMPRLLVEGPCKTDR